VEGVVVVEDDDAVEGVVLGDVGGGYRVLAFDAAEDVGWGSFLRAAERVPGGGLYLALEVEAHAGVERAGGAQAVEEGASERDAVSDLHDALLPHGVHRAEGTLDPGVHCLRRLEAAGRGGDVEDALCQGPVLGGEG
jgi:hypothetical protein